MHRPFAHDESDHDEFGRHEPAPPVRPHPAPADRKSVV